MPVDAPIEVDSTPPTTERKPAPPANPAPLIRGGEQRTFGTKPPPAQPPKSPEPPWRVEDPFEGELPKFGFERLSYHMSKRTQLRREMRGKEIPGKGVLLQSVAIRRLNAGDMKLAESMVWLPGVTLADLREGDAGQKGQVRR